MITKFLKSEPKLYRQNRGYNFLATVYSPP